MEDNDRPAFARAMVGVGEIYGKKISQQQAELYWQALKSYPIEEVEAGMHRHIADPDGGQFMPKPADIIRQIGGSGDTAAMLAWSKVEKATRVTGSYQSVVFDDWRIHAVIRDMGGWVTLCGMNTDDLPFRAREFEKRYRGYRTESAYPPKLIGRSEAHNQAEGYTKFIEPPMLIGNPERAKLVHDKGEESAGVLQIGQMPALRSIGKESKS